MPIRDFLQTRAGDLAVVNGDFQLVGDNARWSAPVRAWALAEWGTDDAQQIAVMQGAACRARMMRGDCWLDEGIGIDYLGRVLVKGARPEVVRQLLTAEISSTPDVTSVQAAALVVDRERRASITYTLRTTYSTTPIEASIGAPA